MVLRTEHTGCLQFSLELLENALKIAFQIKVLDALWSWLLCIGQLLFVPRATFGRLYKAHLLPQVVLHLMGPLSPTRNKNILQPLMFCSAPEASAAPNMPLLSSVPKDHACGQYAWPPPLHTIAQGRSCLTSAVTRPDSAHMTGTIMPMVPKSITGSIMGTCLLSQALLF